MLAIATIGSGVVAAHAHALTLPDHRIWEMVSPADKDGAVYEAINQTVVQASEDGTRLTTTADGVSIPEPDANRSPEPSQMYFARQAPTEWTTNDLATPVEEATGTAPGNGFEYRFFSSDLSQTFLQPTDPTLLSSEASEPTVYRRGSEAGGYTPLVTAANVQPGIAFGDTLQFVDATTDGTKAVIRSEAPLTPGSVTSHGAGNLYLWSAGALTLLNILPDGQQAVFSSEFDNSGEGAALGVENHQLRGAVSRDGSRYFWSFRVSGVRHLYLRDVAQKKTVQLDAVGRDATGEGQEDAQFQFASANGDRVFFTDTQELTPDARTRPLQPDLYECAIVTEEDGSLGCRLVDLTTAAGEPADVQGVLLGASEDGARVYFVAGAALTGAANSQGETAVAGANNIYLDERHGEGWATSFVAKLGEAERAEWENGGDLGAQTTRSSRDGTQLAFMSSRELAGYDNRDAQSGEPAQEVYLYDATSGVLRCPSCKPSGARPHAIFENGTFQGELLVDRPFLWSGQWLAGSITGWPAIDSFHALYEPRNLSDEGRLFFNSADALMPEDINEKEDVYEYEPLGVGDCSATSRGFAERSAGCVRLISSGTSSDESAFLDASASGNDAFFLTSSQLATRDTDESRDVYDAHVCTDSVACAEAPQAAEQPCHDVDSCRTSVASGELLTVSPTMGSIPGGNIVAGRLPRTAVRHTHPRRTCPRVRTHRRRRCKARRTRKAKSRRTGRGSTRPGQVR
jgi:hypothetical protein